MRNGGNLRRRNCGFLDTYWSDHCRHTTFLTKLEGVTIEDGPFSAPITKAFLQYRAAAPAGLRAADRGEARVPDGHRLAAHARPAPDGEAEDQELSSEINACSIVVNIDVSQTSEVAETLKPGWVGTCVGGPWRDIASRAKRKPRMRGFPKENSRNGS